jgi:hypothetical protein
VHRRRILHDPTHTMFVRVEAVAKLPEGVSLKVEALDH